VWPTIIRGSATALFDAARPLLTGGADPEQHPSCATAQQLMMLRAPPLAWRRGEVDSERHRRLACVQEASPPGYPVTGAIGRPSRNMRSHYAL
jgi:hypothetical protein